MSWTMNEAANFVAAIHDDLEAIGCGVGIYGSVARGVLGNDLDLVVWANGGGSPGAFDVCRVFEIHGCYQHAAPYGGGPESYLQFMIGGQEVHVRILSSVAHETPSGPFIHAGRLRPLIDK